MFILHFQIEKKILIQKENKVRNRYYDMLVREKKATRITPKDIRDNHQQQNKNKGNPFKKYRKEYLKKLEEKKQKEREYQERMKNIKLKAKERQLKSILFKKKTKKGQPIMDNLINHYLEKIEKDISRSSTNNDD